MQAHASSDALAGDAVAAEDTRREDRHFVRRLGALTLLAFAVRVGYALTLGDPGGDFLFYRTVAESLAGGLGYVDPLSPLLGDPQPTALHPPLFVLYLAAWTKVGVSSVAGHQAVSCLLGASAVAFIGLLGRRVGGVRVGLIAAGMAAVYPPFVTLDGFVNAESLYAPLIVLVLLSAYRFIERPGLSRAAALGALIGLATLTRSEAALLVPLLGLPLAWQAGDLRIRTFAALALATTLVVAPWVARNWIALDRFPTISTNDGYTALAANCDETYYSDFIGLASHACGDVSACSRLAEVPRSACMRGQARAYVRAHSGRAPLVVLARVERVWGLYRPMQDLGYGSALWPRRDAVATACLIAFATLLPLALAGALLLRARGTPVLPLATTFVLITLVAAMTFGFSRYRLAAEPALLVLAAVVVDALASAITAHRRA